MGSKQVTQCQAGGQHSKQTPNRPNLLPAACTSAAKPNHSLKALPLPPFTSEIPAFGLTQRSRPAFCRFPSCSPVVGLDTSSGSHEYLPASGGHDPPAVNHSAAAQDQRDTLVPRCAPPATAPLGGKAGRLPGGAEARGGGGVGSPQWASSTDQHSGLGPHRNCAGTPCRVPCRAGVSLKTQELYALVFICRYLDLFTNFISP